MSKNLSIVVLVVASVILFAFLFIAPADEYFPYEIEQFVGKTYHTTFHSTIYKGTLDFKVTEVEAGVNTFAALFEKASPRFKGAIVVCPENNWQLVPEASKVGIMEPFAPIHVVTQKNGDIKDDIVTNYKLKDGQFPDWVSSVSIDSYDIDFVPCSSNQ